nr:ORF1a [Duck astrovirus 1]
MAQSGENKAFQSLKRREERRDGKRSPQIPAGLEKVFNFQGMAELYDRMRDLYGNTPAWKALMSCSAIYLKDIKTAFGVRDGRIGLFTASSPSTASWSQDAGAALLTINESACLRAQEAKWERLQVSLRANSSLVNQIMEKNRIAKEKVEELEQLQKKVDNMVENNKLIFQRIEEANQSKLDAMGVKISKLRQENHQWFLKVEKQDNLIESLRKQIDTQRVTYKKMAWDFIAWVILASLLFGFLTTTQAVELNKTEYNVIYADVYGELYTDYPTSQPWDESQISKTCERPDFGCMIVDTWLPLPLLNFEGIMQKCYNTHGNVIARSTFNATYLLMDCVKTAAYFMDKYDYVENYHWCRRRLATLIAANCEGERTIDKFWTQFMEAIDASRSFFQSVKKYQIDVWIIAIFSIVVAGNKEKLLKLIPFVALGWWFKLPIFLLTTAANFFPTTALPFVAFQVIFPEMVMMTTFCMWLTLVLVAFFWCEGLNILVEVSFSILYTIFFFFWAMSLNVCLHLQLTLAYQILLFCISLSIYCGTKFACSQVTIVHPDGTTEKITRVAKVKKAIVNQCKRGVAYLQSRGIIPSSPVKVQSIVIIEGKNGTGTGWRFMNWICTAGHVTRGSEFVTIKYENIAVKVKKEKEIQIFECVDTLVFLKLPKELQSVKPLRLAKEVKSDYMALHCWCPNFQNHVTYSGWCIVDGIFLNNAFNTQFGNSGAPYCDRDGKLVGMHLGSQGVTSQGVVLVDVLQRLNQPIVQQCKDCDTDEFEKQNTPLPVGFDLDLFLSKVIEGTKISHQALLKNVEELNEKVLLMEKNQENQTSSVLEKFSGMFENISETQGAMVAAMEKMSLRVQKLEEERFQEPNSSTVPSFVETLARRIEHLEGENRAILEKLAEVTTAVGERVKEVTLAVNTLVEEKKKGKTKRTARGQKHAANKKFLTKGHFMKMKVLAEEEYQRMLDEGWSADEIRDVVNNLREQAWNSYVMDNDIDEEGEEEWYDEMLQNDAINEEIDRRIEQAMEDMGEPIYQKKRLTFVDQALLHIIRIKKNKVKTVKMEVQKECEEQLKKQFEHAVSPNDIKEGTSVAILSAGEDVRCVENKEINFNAIRSIDMPNQKDKELVMGIKKTVISTGDDNKKNIMREKTTDLVGSILPKNVDGKPEKQNVPQQVPLEQRKRGCQWCNNPKPHNFQACKRRNEKCFCVFCGIMHSENEGHSRKIECVKCKQTFKGVEGLEEHAINGCPKN